MKMTTQTQTGFALPIVIIIAGLASSLLAYDLHRLQQRAQLQQLQLLKGRVVLLMQAQAFQMMAEMNQALVSGGCPENNPETHLCQPDAFVESQVMYFEGQPLTLSMVYVDATSSDKTLVDAKMSNEAVTNPIGQLHISTALEAQGLDLQWQRSAYVLMNKNEQGQMSLVRSALVHNL